jgi:ketosteroid isomerase-like protein
MSNLRSLTEQYVSAFHSKDLSAIAVLMAEDFTLTDPSVSSLRPKEKALQYIKELFDNNPSLSFEAHKILIDAPYSALHFAITLNGTIHDGVDMITWMEGKMISMDAYLAPRPED